MRLDIIVPHFNEPWETCKYLFDSIAMQRGVNFNNIRVVIVNDGLESQISFPPDDFKTPYEIQTLWKEHEGVSAARNLGLQYSDADYVMFCDCDDGFLNNYGLHAVLWHMLKGFDFLYSSFLEEVLTADGITTTLRHDRDLTFMHGKVFNRRFLIDNDLFFDSRMEFHEDNYFNMLVYIVAKNKGVIKNIDVPFYLWCHNVNSVTRRHKGSFTLKTYQDLLFSKAELCKELRERGYSDEFEAAVVIAVLNCYYDFQKPDYYDNKNEKYIATAENAVKKFYSEFKNVFLHCPDEKLMELAGMARENAVRNGMRLERTDLASFLRHIEYDMK